MLFEVYSLRLTSKSPGCKFFWLAPFELFFNGKIPAQFEAIDCLIILNATAGSLFENSIKAVEEHDFEKAENVAEKVREIIDEEKQIMKKIKDSDKNATTIKFVLEDLRRISEYSGDIAEVSIDENIQNIISEE